MSENLKARKDSVNSSRENIAHNLIGRMAEDSTIGSIGCFVTVHGQDVWVQAIHEDHLEDETFVDDTPVKEDLVDPNQNSLGL